MSLVRQMPWLGSCGRVILSLLQNDHNPWMPNFPIYIFHTFHAFHKPQLFHTFYTFQTSMHSIHCTREIWMLLVSPWILRIQTSLIAPMPNTLEVPHFIHSIIFVPQFPQSLHTFHITFHAFQGVLGSPNPGCTRRRFPRRSPAPRRWWWWSLCCTWTPAESCPSVGREGHNENQFQKRKEFLQRFIQTN